jgi:hypothetical protein
MNVLFSPFSPVCRGMDQKRPNAGKAMQEYTGAAGSFFMVNRRKRAMRVASPFFSINGTFFYEGGQFLP